MFVRWRSLSPALILGAAIVLTILPSVAATAQESVSSGGEDDKDASARKSPLPPSPFADPKPGQIPSSSPETPTGVTIGPLHWYPIVSRCTFVDPSLAQEQDTGSQSSQEPPHEPYVFLTMVEATKGSRTPLERGYVMANGLVRELEKGKTAPNRNGNVVTVFRSASEPRINVNIVISSSKPGDGGPRYEGTMTVFWGDKQEQVPIEGTCRS